jgi:Holliday junction resolvase-like predicted endonuclease
MMEKRKKDKSYQNNEPWFKGFIYWILGFLTMFGMTIKNNYLKEKWRIGEDIVAKHYESLWYFIKTRNYTFRGGELDIVASKWDNLVFVEVKVIDYIEDTFDYLTPKKLSFLKRAIEYYITDHPTRHEISLDVVFVQGNRIVETYHNVTNT